MRCRQYIVNTVLAAYAMDVVEANFDTGVGLDVGVDLYTYTVSASALNCKRDGHNTGRFHSICVVKCIGQVSLFGAGRSRWG